MRDFFIALTRSPTSLVGSAITTASAVLFISLFAIEMLGFEGSPYLGILTYMILPGVFVLGLGLIPLGIWNARRKARRSAAMGEVAPVFPVIDLNVTRVRKWVVSFLILSSANVVIMAVATYKGVEVMESTEFCGTTCHSVMAPEHTAHQRSAHARVACVSCHIGPGANWFVKSKLSGAWQVAAVAFDLYPRPISTPVHNLRPARETCEQCHWPTKFVGDRMKVITRHENDEANTELKTVLVLRVGGMSGEASGGIHWHVDPRVEIRYRSDPSREQIYEVQMTDENGTVKTFHAPDDEDAADETEWRVMDCIDCHNRPSHVFRSPTHEVDLALKEGALPRSLPFVRREGIRIVQEEYASAEEARVGIGAALVSVYEKEYPQIAAEQRPLIEEAGEVLFRLYGYNVFPGMGVSWGTYPEHIGHEASDGCFRCHDDEHATSDGETISQDCFTCHALLAMEEEEPEILAMLEP